MWKRATWHECADELDEVCKMFRRAYFGKRHKGWPRHPEDMAEMEATSKRGIRLLRALALAVRSEQDFNVLPINPLVVGALKTENAVPSDATEAKQRLGYTSMLKINGYHPLNLRQAFNKIAHADPNKTDYYVGALDRAHDLLLYGTNQGQSWFAVVSIIDIVKAIHALPDTTIVGISNLDCDEKQR